MSSLLIALILGFFFGFLLNKAGLTKYAKIVNVFRFTDMAVLQFMMTALVVAMIGLYSLRAFRPDYFSQYPGNVYRWAT